MRHGNAEKIIDQVLGQTDFFDKGWSWVFAENLLKGKKRFAECDYSSRTLRFDSEHVRHSSERRVRQLAFHELAHYLNPKDSHGKAWRSTAKEMGYRPRWVGYDKEVMERRSRIVNVASLVVTGLGIGVSAGNLLIAAGRKR